MPSQFLAPGPWRKARILRHARRHAEETFQPPTPPPHSVRGLPLLEPAEITDGHVPTVDEVLALISHAEQVMARCDLNPTFLRHSKDKGFAPALYDGSGSPPLYFDTDQGWEVPTEQGRELDLAIRRVGAAIAARADHHRQHDPLTPNRITGMRREAYDGWGLPLDPPNGAPAPEALATALGLDPTPPPAFTSRAAYVSAVNRTLKHITAALEAQAQLTMGDGKPDVLTFAEREAYKKAKGTLENERNVLSGDCAPSMWAYHQARLDYHARQTALAEVRAMGGTYTDTALTGRSRRCRRKHHDMRRADFARKVVGRTATHIPTAWVERINSGRLCVEAPMWGGGSRWVVTLKPGKRPDPHLRQSRSSKTNYGPMSGWEADALHEMCHHLEFLYPEINQIARTHKALRTTDEQGILVPIELLKDPCEAEGTSDPWPAGMGSNTRFRGWRRPGFFAAVYAGQETMPWGSEVFSTGVEAALGGRYESLAGHDGGKADPEHLNMVLGILATVGRR